jgi:hypothetical protein
MALMKLEEAERIAARVRAELAPYCERIEIAGSVRRRKAEVGDIEVVAIPKPYDVGLFASGIAPVVTQWPKVKGELPCKYTRRMLPEGIALDLFLANRANWGLILAIRTGSAAYSHEVLAHGWSVRGWKSSDGYLHNRAGVRVATPEEQDVFAIAGVPWVEPEKRDLLQERLGDEQRPRANEKTMPCLSVRQPWAWLIVNGWKNVENRTWPTRQRGRILIHAGKTMTQADYDACLLFMAAKGLSAPVPPFAALERGGIVGETTILDCVERHASEWFEGPFGFVVDESRPLPFEPCAGALGFFPVRWSEGA